MPDGRFDDKQAKNMRFYLNTIKFGFFFSLLSFYFILHMLLGFTDKLMV